MDRISLEEASARLITSLNPVEDTVTVALCDAPGRVLARDLFARVDVPAFDRSPLDGYAVRSEDIKGAGPDIPAVLTVVGCVFAGGWYGERVEAGQAVRVMTGAPIPAGADCVVAQEETDQGEQTVRVFAPVGYHQNFCFRGEDVALGAPLFPKGTRLDWTHIPALASQGFDTVEVYRPLRVAVLATGDELTAPGRELAPGKIYDSNSPLFLARLAALHMVGVPCPTGADDPEALCAILREALTECDAVITSGGVSVGQKDCMPRVAELLGAELLFHGVAVRPGSPVMALLAEGKPVIALSGNPFAAAAVFEAMVRPVLEHLSGCTEVFPRRCSAVLHGSFPKPSKVRRLVRARLAGGEVFVAEGGHASGMTLGMAGCNCLIDIPAGKSPLAEGAQVDVVLF